MTPPLSCNFHLPPLDWNIKEDLLSPEALKLRQEALEIYRQCLEKSSYTESKVLPSQNTTKTIQHPLLTDRCGREIKTYNPKAVPYINKEFIGSLADSVRSLDLDITDIVFNGGQLGDRYSEFECRDQKDPRCPETNRGKMRHTLHVQRDTLAHVHAEVRPIANTNRSDLLVYWTKLNKPMEFMMPGLVDLNIHGFYGTNPDAEDEGKPDMPAPPLHPLGKAKIPQIQTHPFDLPFQAPEHHSNHAILRFLSGIGGRSKIPLLAPIAQGIEILVADKDSGAIGSGDRLTLSKYLLAKGINNEDVFYKPYGVPHNTFPRSFGNLLRIFSFLFEPHINPLNGKIFGQNGEAPLTRHQDAKDWLAETQSIWYNPNTQSPDLCPLEKPNLLLDYGKAKNYKVKASFYGHKIKAPWGEIQFKENEVLDFEFHKDPQSGQKIFEIKNLQIAKIIFNANHIEMSADQLGIDSLLIQLPPTAEELSGLRVEVKGFHATNLKLKINGISLGVRDDLKVESFKISGTQDGSIIGKLTQITANGLFTSTQKLGSLDFSSTHLNNATFLFHPEQKTLVTTINKLHSDGTFSFKTFHQDPFDLKINGKFGVENIYYQVGEENGEKTLKTSFDLTGDMENGTLYQNSLGRLFLSTHQNEDKKGILGRLQMEHSLASDHFIFKLKVPFLGLGADTKIVSSNIEDSYVENAEFTVDNEKNTFSGNFHLRFPKINLANIKMGIPRLKLYPILEDMRITGPAIFTAITNKKSGSPAKMLGWTLKKQDGTKENLSLTAKLTHVPGKPTLEHFPVSDKDAKKNPRLAEIAISKVDTEAELEIQDIRTMSFHSQDNDLFDFDFGPFLIKKIRGNAILWVQSIVWGYLRGVFVGLGGPGKTPEMPLTETLIKHLGSKETLALSGGDFLRIDRFHVTKDSEGFPKTEIDDLLVQVHEDGGRHQFFMLGIPKLLLHANPNAYPKLSTERQPIFMHGYLSSPLRKGWFRFNTDKTYHPSPELIKKYSGR